MRCVSGGNSRDRSVRTLVRGRAARFVVNGVISIGLRFRRMIYALIVRSTRARPLRFTTAPSFFQWNVFRGAYRRLILPANKIVFFLTGNFIESTLRRIKLFFTGNVSIIKYFSFLESGRVSGRSPFDLRRRAAGPWCSGLLRNCDGAVSRWIKDTSFNEWNEKVFFVSLYYVYF
jgi:hypothetical protein